MESNDTKSVISPHLLIVIFPIFYFSYHFNSFSIFIHVCSVVCVFFFLLHLLFACLPEVPAEPSTPAPQPTIPLAENSEKTSEAPGPVTGAVTENPTMASPGVSTPVTKVPGQSRTQAEQASGTTEAAVVMRRKSKPPQPTLKSIPDEDGFEEDDLPGESAAVAAVPAFSDLFYSRVSYIYSHV